MPITPSLREGRLTGTRNPATAFLHDFLSAWGFRAVTIAFRLKVFDSLQEQPATAAELARRLGIDPKGAAFLLDALDCMGYVRARHGRYGNTTLANELLPMIDGGIPYFEKIVFKDWENLESRLRQESELPFRPDEPRTPRWLAKEWRVFQDGMVALAAMNIDEVVQRVRVPRSARHVLDIGGGHGLYSIALCKRHPRLSATVFEIPEMERIARRTIDEHGMTGRVDFRAGDFFVDDLGAYDLALLFNVIHSKSEPQNRKLVERVVAALPPGGGVALLDQFPSRRLGGVGRAFGSLMSLSMFNNIGQQTYQLTQVADWFRAAGLVAVRSLPIRSAPGNALVVGRRPG
jgi:hypothetical protein